MNFGDMKKKGQDFLNSDKGEQASDKALDKGEQMLDQRTGGKHDEQIAKGRDFADEHIGQRDTSDPQQNNASGQ